MAFTVSSTLGVNADVWTFQGLLGALVYVLTGLPVSAKKHSLRTEAEDLKISAKTCLCDFKKVSEFQNNQRV
jgi:hypothetical protein